MPWAPQKHDPHPRQQRKRTEDRRSAGERGYDNEWRKIRQARLELEPWCRRCEERGIIVAAKLIVDHVIPLHVRPDLRLDLDNTQTLCRRCHKIKTDEDLRRYGAAR